MEQTDDVVQGTLIRLMRSLETIKPASMREFFGLANEQVRRELLDLVKRYQAAKRPPLQYLPQAPHDKSGGGWEPPANDASQFELDSWQRFHEAITQLPDEEREVMSLIFYQGWTQKDVASFLDVSDRQVRRYWTSACKTLREQLHGELPTL
jgi:RNA polymerase sigma-70 factor (ECF subfamily)